MDAAQALAADDLDGAVRILKALAAPQLTRTRQLQALLDWKTDHGQEGIPEVVDRLLESQPSLAELREAANLLTERGLLKQARPLWAELGRDLPGFTGWRWPEERARDRLRILFLGDVSSPHLCRFAGFFFRQGHEVHVLSRHPGEIPGVAVHVPDPVPGPLALVDWALLAQQAIRSIAPDVVHGHYASIEGLWGALTGFHPYVSTIWGSDINVDPNLDPKYRALIRFGLLQADAMTAHTADLVEKSRRLAGRPIADIRVVHFSPDPEVFRPGLDGSEIRRRLGIGPGPVVFSPRQFKPAANIHRLVEAIPRVLESFPEACFVLMTYNTPEDAYYHSLVDQVRSLGVEARVRFVNGVDHAEMPLWYAMASVTLSIRDVDGGSVTSMESLACGTPLVLSNIAANRELYEGAALFVDPHDVPNLGAAICEALANGLEISALRQAGRERMAAIGSYDRQMGQVADMYRVLLARPARYFEPFHAALAKAQAWEAAGAKEIATAMLAQLAGQASSAEERSSLWLTVALLSGPWSKDPGSGVQRAIHEALGDV